MTNEIILLQDAWEKEVYKDKSNPPPTDEANTEEKEEARPRNFFINTYISPIAVDSFLRSAKWVKHWAFITHDKDTFVASSKEVLCGKKKIGDKKETHTHILLRTYNGKTLSSVIKLFDRFSASYYSRMGLEKQNTFGEIARDVVDCYQYLTHKNDPLKYQYDNALIVSDCAQYWHDLTKGIDDDNTADNKAFSMFCDVLGGMTTPELLKRYGMAYLMQNRNVDRLVEKCTRESGHSTYQPEDIFGLMFKSADCPYTTFEINQFWAIFEWLTKTQKTKTSAQIEIYLNYGDNENGSKN